MGFFDSLFKSTVRRVVNNVVDNAVDKAFNNNNTTTTYNNQQQPMTQPMPQAQPQQIRYGAPITLPQPDLNMAYEQCTDVISPCIIEDDNYDEYVEIKFFKPIKLFPKDSGAAEISILFMVADTENEAYSDNAINVLPAIYFGNDIFFDDPSFKNKINNAIFSKVENHPCIHEKQEFDFNNTHYIIYNFYSCDRDRYANRSTSITLEIPFNCAQDKKLYAIQALNLLLYSFTPGNFVEL